MVIRIGKIGVVKNGYYGSRIEINGGVESVEVEVIENWFIIEEFLNRIQFDEWMIFSVLNFDYFYVGYDMVINLI